MSIYKIHVMNIFIHYMKYNALIIISYIKNAPKGAFEVKIVAILRNYKSVPVNIFNKIVKVFI